MLEPHADTSNSASPPVLLLHDVLEDRSVWKDLRLAIGDRRRVLIPEARGHGASPTLANQWYSVAELAADVVAVLDAEEIEQAAVVGRGLGGTTAIAVALAAPDRIASLIAIDPAVVATTPDRLLAPSLARQRDDWRQADRAAGETAYKGLLDNALDRYWTTRQGADWRSRWTRVQLGAMRRHAAALAALLPALDGFVVDLSRLRQFTTPFDLILTEANAPFAVELDQAIVEAMPSAALRHIPAPDVLRTVLGVLEDVRQ